MKIQLEKNFEDIASVENLLEAWREFLPGKRKKRDVQEFQLRLMDNILALHADLMNGSYRHGGYHAFNISDPKPRSIHKATVRDRLLHHAIYRQLHPFFDRTFIADSFSCRIGKGTHRALNRFRSFGRAVSKNNTRTCWVLKCDIRKFFANIDHAVLMEVLGEYISDKKILSLVGNIVGSFSSGTSNVSSTSNVAGASGIPNLSDICRKGLPLGNLTSQILVNIYMNEFDQFAKHHLCAKNYIRYADDFVFLSTNRQWLEITLREMELFLKNRLKLQLHPDKVFIKTLASGVDFLGWIHFPNHRVLRNATKRRMIKRVDANPKDATIASYLGLLKHGNGHSLEQQILTMTDCENRPGVLRLR